MSAPSTRAARRIRRALTLTAVAATTLVVVVGAAPVAAEPDPEPEPMPAPEPAPEPAVPTFVNGLAQNVFSANSADWVRGEAWVESNFDSDNDGKLDRIHIDITRPKETDTDGLKVPVVFEDSPYYANLGPARNWSVNHEIGFPPASRVPEPYFNARVTSPKISTIYESTWLPRGFAVVHA